MKLSRYKLRSDLKEKYVKEFYNVVSDIHDPTDFKDFGDHLFTPTEIEAFAKRIAILKGLRKALSYAEIKETVKVTTATITKMANILQKASKKFVEFLDDLNEEDGIYKKHQRESKYTGGSKRLYKKNSS